MASKARTHQLAAPSRAPRCRSARVWSTRLGVGNSRGRACAARGPGGRRAGRGALRVRLHAPRPSPSQRGCGRRPDMLVVSADGDVELAEPSGAHVSWLEAALRPERRRCTVLPLDGGARPGERGGDARARFAARARPGRHRSAAARRAQGFQVDEIELQRFLRSVRRDLDVDEPALERIQTVFDLSRTELGRPSGPPPGHQRLGL